MKQGLESISYQEAVEFLLPRHYSGRTPSISYSFGWFSNGVLMAVCTFGKPASPPLCRGVCGDEWSPQVYELNRLCRESYFSGIRMSKFVSACLRQLKKHNLIIVSYSDTAMKHHGYVYQACNFIYTGFDPFSHRQEYTPGNKHCRHYDNDDQKGLRKVRSSKHRYIYFCMKKSMKKKALRDLNYKIQPYPKGNNKNYKLGDYLEPVIIGDKS